MSATPRTDAVARYVEYGGVYELDPSGPYVPTGVARQLELELAEANRRLGLDTVTVHQGIKWQECARCGHRKEIK